jgi:adenosine deaminase
LEPLARPLEYYQALPKVDLHRHLEGSLRLETMAEIARSHPLDLPVEDLRALVQVLEGEPNTAANFLSKFETLRKFYRSPEIIRRVAAEAVADAALDNVRYLELRFTPVALSRIGGYAFNDVMNWVATAVQQACETNRIQVGLICSVNRHESVELAEQVIGLAADCQEKGVVGVDLAGNEAAFSALPFAPLFQAARQAGLHVTVHAAEWGPGANVAEAIEKLGAERIGHGIRVLEDPYSVAVARERGTAFDVCLTSNLQSGAAASLQQHPLPQMLAAGLNVTLNTDDPSISNITLSREYQIACEELGLAEETLQTLIDAARRAAFVGGGKEITANRW